MTRNRDIATILGRSEKDNAGNQSLVTPGRNLIINGAMSISQRTDGQDATGKTTGGFHQCDRWYNQISGAGTFTISKDSADHPDLFSESIKYECTTANASLGSAAELILYQKIEGQNLQNLGFGTSSAKDVTLSFYVKSNLTGTLTAELYNIDPATNRQCSKTYTIDAADTWEYKTITYPGDTAQPFTYDNTVGLYMLLWLGAGSTRTSGTLNSSGFADQVLANRVSSSNLNLASSTSNYIAFTGVQLEAGSNATPFEHKPYVQDMTECLRYFNRYRKTNSYGEFVTLRTYSATQGTGLHQFPTPMRAAPTLTIDKAVNGTYFAYNLNAISITGTDGNFTGCGFHATSASNSFVTGGGAVIQSNAVQDISFNLSAELA